MRAAFAALALAAGCGDGVRRYEAHGIVRDVDAELGQIVIEHEDIPGLMPAMTMGFDVADPAILASAKPGQSVEFEVAFDGSSYRVTELEPQGGTNRGAERAPAPHLSDVATVSDPAPEFRLLDPDGRTVALADLHGAAVVLDFIYTSCPGPCPIQTSKLVTLQRSLPPDLRTRTRFVSISLDPAIDTPERMGEYGAKRGADLSTWSFLTGTPETVGPVVRAYGVGTLRNPDGTIGHIPATFLVDPEGRIAKRYLGGDHGPEEIAADLARVLATSPAPAGVADAPAATPAAAAAAAAEAAP